MSSWYSLKINDFELFSFNAPIDDSFLSLFWEDQRQAGSCGVSCGPDDEPRSIYCYRASVMSVRDRLEVLGFTEKATKEDFDSGTQSLLDEQSEYIAYLSNEGDSTKELLLPKAVKDNELVRSFDFDTWLCSMQFFKSQNRLGINYRLDKTKFDAAQLFMLKDDAFWGFRCSDIRFVVRAFLLTCTDTDEIILDYTELVESGDVDPEENLVEQAQVPTQRTILVTEGPSDTDLIKATMRVFYPHVIDLYTFVDRTTFAMEGGASAAFNLVKSLASCSISNRVIALFDNDTAGSAILEKTKYLKLPKHFVTLKLPPLDLAKKYPTIGPHGTIIADVNSCACSIEMYLGPGALRTEDGSLMPIQWTGYDKGQGRYQGELLDKRGVRQRYMRMLQQASKFSEEEFASMKLVLKVIFTAFHQS